MIRKGKWSSSLVVRRLWRVWMALFITLGAFVAGGQVVAEGQGDQEESVPGLSSCGLSGVVYDPFALDLPVPGCLMPTTEDGVQAELTEAIVPSCGWTGVTYDPFALDPPRHDCSLPPTTNEEQATVARSNALACDDTTETYDPFALDMPRPTCLQSLSEAEELTLAVPQTAACDLAAVIYDPFALDHPPHGCTWMSTPFTQ